MSLLCSAEFGLRTAAMSASQFAPAPTAAKGLQSGSQEEDGLANGWSGEA